MSFRCIKAFMHAFSGRFSRTCLKGISFKFFVCFIFNVSLGSAPKRKNFDIQRNTRVGSGGQFTSNRLSNDHICSSLFDARKIHFFQVLVDFQTLAPWFPPKFVTVSTTNICQNMSLYPLPIPGTQNMSLYLIPGQEKIQWHRTAQSTHCALDQALVIF